MPLLSRLPVAAQLESARGIAQQRFVEAAGALVVHRPSVADSRGKTVQEPGKQCRSRLRPRQQGYLKLSGVVAQRRVAGASSGVRSCLC